MITLSRRLCSSIMQAIQSAHCLSFFILIKELTEAHDTDCLDLSKIQELNMSINARSVFDKNIKMVFSKAVSLMMSKPDKIAFFLKALKNQNSAKNLRNKHLKNGLEVPPLLIISLTSDCNLNCKGCYSKKLHQHITNKLSAERFRAILSEASTLGISIILLAGGEPLMRWDLIEIAAEFPKIMFPIFTNGLLIDQQKMDFFLKHKHLIPVISLEGKENETDERRGIGVWDNFQLLKEELNLNNMFWGISLTVTSENYNLVTSDDFTTHLLKKGCSLFFYVEYVPINQDKNLVLTPQQKETLQPLVDRFMDDFAGIFVAFPGDENQYDGCLAAGKGFFHINPAGAAEPCPFAPFSDFNLNQSSLKEALQSPLFSFIREHHHLLKETEGGCALWANKEFLEQFDLIKKQ